MAGSGGNTNETVQATETSFELLGRIRDTNGSTLSELANYLDLAKSTTHRHLLTLENLEYVVREGNEYYLALRFLKLGESAQSRWPHFGWICKGVETLAEETDERVQFIAEEHEKGVCVYRSAGKRAVKTSPRVGAQMPLHAIAAGKAILAFDSDTDLDRLSERGLDASTDQTITDLDQLQAELEEVRHQRYAVNRDEHIEGLTAFGTPIRHPDEGVIGAFSISGPTNRLSDPDREETLTTLLLGTANEVELNIAHGGSPTGK